MAAKSSRATAVGLASIPELSRDLFPFQAHITQWALRKGRAAIFAGCGLGKSWMALEWARCVAEYTDAPVLILTPLAVAAQFVREGVKLGVPVVHLREDLHSATHSHDDYAAQVIVTNYERLEKFPNLIAQLGGIVLDESSILKSFDGKTRTALIEAFAHVPFKLCCTASPAPNDPVELGNHAEFLGMSRHIDMLQRYFEHDASDTGNWVLKGHGRKPFWRWVGEWAMCLNKPSDLGFSDEGYELPDLVMHEHVVDVDKKMAHQAGLLFAYEAVSLAEQRVVRRASLADRVALAAEVVNADDEQWLVWAGLNDESDALTKAIRGAVDVSGSDSAESKEANVLAFLDGKTRVIVSKMRILAFGINAQCCSHQLFVGADHSFEQQYQAIRRSHRFGQRRPVHIHQICTSADGRVVHNLKRKRSEFDAMHRELAEVLRGNGS